MKTKLMLAGGITAAFAAGTLFGPLDLASAGHTNRVLTADLTGRAEVRTDATDRRIAGDPNGSGEAYVFGIDANATTLCYVLTVEGIAPATAAHIHEGPPGENGPVVVTLARPTDGNSADCLVESDATKFAAGQTVAEILADPGDYYVNVHNEEHPGGALRGQLRPER